MKNTLLASAGLALVCAVPSYAFGQEQEETALQDVVVVTGHRTDDTTTTALRPESAPLDGPDISQLVARTPGAARVGNGKLSGQVAYRGLAGERLNLSVDGQSFASAGPNLMDPVFHFAPGALVESIVVDRGVSPVSKGPGLGGGADAVFKKVDFTDDASFTSHYDLTVGARSNDESTMFGGIIGASSDRFRINVLGASEQGGNTKFKGGEIASSGFERSVFGVSAGARIGVSEVGLDLRRQNTGASGNPPFPMDIRYVDGDFARLTFDTEFAETKVSMFASYADVTHAMNNFDERPAPDPSRYRENTTSGETRAAGISLQRDVASGELDLGIDGMERKYDAFITNPNMAAFFVHALPDVEMERLGAYVEWTGDFGLIETELGMRVDRHAARSGDADLAAMLPMGAQMAAMTFNNLDHDWSDTTTDISLRAWTKPENGLSWRGTLARKTHIGTALQRFAWLPLQASGGLADGNTYVGDVALSPEVALIAELGFDYSDEAIYLRPTVFVRSVDDYIQGVPFDDTPDIVDSPLEMVSAMNGGDDLLRFANVDARLYGVDVDAGWDIEGPLRLDGVVSYVKGERRDIDDALYRLSPLRAQTTLTWETADWSAGAELVGVARQNRVSITNNEEKTPGYVVVNLHGSWSISDTVSAAFGVENLLDHQTRDHLAGYNRVSGSDVALGARLPGAGRGVYLRINVRG